MVTRSWILCIGLWIIFSLGCSNPQERSDEAKAAINEEKAEIMRDYRACLKKHTDPEEHAVCDRYKSALEHF
jgi:hypothetical protein